MDAYDLVIVGGTAGGLSVAVSSRRSGLERIRIVEAGRAVMFPELVGEEQLDVGYGEEIVSIDSHGETVVVDTTKLSYRTRACLIADRRSADDWQPPIPVTASERVHIDELPVHQDEDVLVVGYTDHAVELTAVATSAGARVVLAAGGMDPTKLSPAGDNLLRRLERERRATLLYRAVPQHIGEVNGYPMVYFGDRRTPDLQFDHVVFASLRQTLTPAEVGCSSRAASGGRVWFLGEPDAGSPPFTSPGHRIGVAIAKQCFPELDLKPEVSAIVRRGRHQGAIEELQTEHYNASISHFEPTHSDLWVLRVRPDTGDTSFVPGQYASLGLGYWEPRIDQAEDPDLDNRWQKLIRRSYSISSRIFDDNGYLADDNTGDELEFYIVLVRLGPHKVPALTPRLALKQPGDRIYLGPKIAGRYTLTAVTDPTACVAFLGTGTGEAPHNAMIVELLRKGHVGPVVSAVSVRQWNDLGYLEQHRALEDRYFNYHYLPLPTREADVSKRYIQDVLRCNALAGELGVSLDPERSHVFLCGNPAMIGLPRKADSGLVYPEPAGVVEILENLGFQLDQRGRPGNIHYEEYW